MSASVSEVLSTLTEMGFTEARAKKALANTQWSGVEAAMEWLLSHPDDGDDDGADMETETASAAVEDTPKKELTAEEKAAQLQRLEELRVKKRAEREAKEKQEELEREKRRVVDGKALSDIRHRMEEQEMKKLADQRRREKLETQKAKERVLAQIEADRQARKAKEAGAQDQAQAAAPPAQVVQPPTVETEKPEYAEARIQLRLPDGSTLVQNFQSKETLSAVRLFVQLNRKDGGATGALPVKLMTNFPKKVFTDEEYDMPLDVLGLVPSAVVIVSK